MILNKGADGHLYGHQTLHGFEFTNEFAGSIPATSIILIIASQTSIFTIFAFLRSFDL
jgi:hypothetical protein